MENFRQANLELDYNINMGMNKDKLKKLEKYIAKINSIFKKENQNFTDLCFYVYQVKSLFIADYCYTRKGNMLQFNSIMEHFGITETEQSRLCSCYDKFIETTLSEDRFTIISYKLKEEFQPFSKSKLFELLLIPTEQLLEDIRTKVLRYDMSVKTIREYVKNYKALQKSNKKLDKEKEEVIEEINEDEIPMAYNPKQHYDFDYFKDKGKAELLNMIWSLQLEYERLKKELKK